MDFDDFTLEEHQLINYAVTRINENNKQSENESWGKFFKKGFESVVKAIANSNKIK